MKDSVALDRTDPKIGGSTIRTGKLTIDLDRRVVRVDGNPLHLTRKEYEILELLSLRKGTILTKEMFVSRLYGDGRAPEHKIIDSLYVSCAKSWSTRPAAVSTSRRCGATRPSLALRLKS